LAQNPEKLYFNCLLYFFEGKQKMSKINVEFGETREDRRISALGKIRHALKISPSFALCALDLNGL
jgi:hypothetical protein